MDGVDQERTERVEPGMLARDGAANDPAATFARLAVEFHDSDGVEETVEAVVEFALDALGCSYAGVALAVRGLQPEIPAVTDPVVAEIYQFQMAAGDGPLVESMRDHTTLLIRDTATEQRWAAKVLSLGVRSVLDVPLATGNGTVGVLGADRKLPPPT